MRNVFLIFIIIFTCNGDPKTPRVYNVLITSKKNLSPSQALPVYEPVLRTTSVGFAFPPFFYTHLAPIDATSYVSGLPLQSSQVSSTKTQVLQNPPELEQDRYVPPQSVNQNIPKNPSKSESSSAGALPPPQTYPESAPDTRNLPSNVVPLEQFVPLYSPQLTYQQYYPKQEPSASTLNFKTATDQLNFEAGTPLLNYEPGASPSNFEPGAAPSNFEPGAAPINFEKVYEEPKSQDPKQIVANFKRNPEIPDVPPPPLPVRNNS